MMALAEQESEQYWAVSNDSTLMIDWHYRDVALQAVSLSMARLEQLLEVTTEDKKDLSRSVEYIIYNLDSFNTSF
jgi:hypothetical protein